MTTQTDSDTNNGQGFQVTRPTTQHGPTGARLVNGETTYEKHLKRRPRLTKEEINGLIEAKIRGQLSLDEFRLKVRKSRAQAFRIIRAFKESADYDKLLDDEWDRMTFSKEFDREIPAVERYRMITQLKKQRMMRAEVTSAGEKVQVVFKWVTPDEKQAKG